MLEKFLGTVSSWTKRTLVHHGLNVFSPCSHPGDARHSGEADLSNIAKSRTRPEGFSGAVDASARKPTDETQESDQVTCVEAPGSLSHIVERSVRYACSLASLVCMESGSPSLLLCTFTSLTSRSTSAIDATFCPHRLRVFGPQFALHQWDSGACLASNAAYSLDTAHTATPLFRISRLRFPILEGDPRCSLCGLLKEEKGARERKGGPRYFLHLRW